MKINSKLGKNQVKLHRIQQNILLESHLSDISKENSLEPFNSNKKDNPKINVYFIFILRI